jgi:leader peptidase (prepilin peptidase) / N-methyltransferase
VIYIEMFPWVLYPFLFVFGSIVGSFLNVCAYRIPQKEKLWESLQLLWARPSHCRRCQTNIPWHDNIPIFGWLFLKGRCRSCRAWISPRYPTVELVTALLFVLVFWCEIGWGTAIPLKESTIYSPIGPQHAPGLHGVPISTFVMLRYAYHMVLICALIVASLIDFDLRIIPDGSTLPAMAVGFAASLVGCVHIVPVWFENVSLFADTSMAMPHIPEWIKAHPHLHGLAVSVAGFAVGWAMIWTVRLLGNWALKQEAMGFGDVILMGTIGSFLGWQPTIIVFFVAPVIALTVVVLRLVFKRERAIPYGPYLSGAAVVTLVAWPKLWPMIDRVVGSGVLIVPIVLISIASLAVSLMLARMIRLSLGFGDLAPEQVNEWSAADQHELQAGERNDIYQGLWRPGNAWPGIQSGRGMIHVERWKGR